MLYIFYHNKKKDRKNFHLSSGPKNANYNNVSHVLTESENKLTTATKSYPGLHFQEGTCPAGVRIPALPLQLRDAE